MNEDRSMARADSGKNPKSIDSLRQSSIREKVRSTIHLFGMTENFLDDSSDLSTTESLHLCRAVPLASSSPLYSPSDRTVLGLGYLFARFLNISFVPTLSKTFTA